MDIKELKPNKNVDLAVAPQVEKDYFKYLFQILTKPNGGIYEFEIVIENNIRIAKRRRNNINNNLKDSLVLNHNLISRINKYGNDESCIHDTFPDLRKFCYCKIKFVEDN